MDEELRRGVRLARAVRVPDDARGRSREGVRDARGRVQDMQCVDAHVSRVAFLLFSSAAARVFLTFLRVFARVADPDRATDDARVVRARA